MRFAKNINGRVYKLYQAEGIQHNKESAKRKAKNLRAKGWLARIYPSLYSQKASYPKQYFVLCIPK